MAKVLIVEDDPFIRNVYEKILSKDNHDVKTAKDGQEGIEVAASHEPDLIILDMMMPVLDGIQFLEAYDIKGSHPDVKVIVLSNIMSQDKINRAIELGAVNYKTKAMFSPREMIDLVQQTLKS
jgi:CheY-like chemotaxis protein